MPTRIEWCDETFNPWWGCERVSPACAHCYADDTAKFRTPGLHLWGADHDFRFFPDAHWQDPLRWARTLPARLGRRPRVFCASMADVFEERLELGQPRERLFALIAATPELDWLMLTKRPEYARAVMAHPMFWLGVNAELLKLGHSVLPGGMSDSWAGGQSHLPNLWMGVSIENARFTWRADVLREIPAAVRFISAEPLLGSLYPRLIRSDDRLARREPHGRAPLDLTGIDWVIIGGESGPRARPFHLEHARELVGHAVVESLERTGYANDSAVAVFVKQLGAKPVDADAPLKLRDRKGGNPDEWPADLRIREHPATAAVPA